MGLAAFVFFIVPWMLAAAWLFRLPSALRMGTNTTPWRPLTQFPDPARDQQAETPAHHAGSADGTGATGGNKHTPYLA